MQWSKSRFCAGRVTAFDPATRMHTITYDDGDVRHYNNLAIKTIEWLDENDYDDAPPEEQSLENNN